MGFQGLISNDSSAFVKVSTNLLITLILNKCCNSYAAATAAEYKYNIQK